MEKTNSMNADSPNIPKAIIIFVGVLFAGMLVSSIFLIIPAAYSIVTKPHYSEAVASLTPNDAGKGLGTVTHEGQTINVNFPVATTKVGDTIEFTLADGDDTGESLQILKVSVIYGLICAGIGIAGIAYLAHEWRKRFQKK